MTQAPRILNHSPSSQMEGKQYNGVNQGAPQKKKVMLGNAAANSATNIHNGNNSGSGVIQVQGHSG